MIFPARDPYPVIQISESQWSVQTSPPRPVRAVLTLLPSDPRDKHSRCLVSACRRYQDAYAQTTDALPLFPSSATHKSTETGSNDKYAYGVSEMQGWRIGESQRTSRRVAHLAMPSAMSRSCLAHAPTLQAHSVAPDSFLPR